MNIVAFNGSGRKDGNTATLLKIVLDEMEKEGFDTELYQLAGKNIRGCTACYKCKEAKNGKCSIDNDVLNECVDKMRAADGILIGSPTYFSDVSAETKALIDRSGMVARVNGDMLKRKPGAAVVSVRRAGAMHTFDTINHFFTISQMIIPGSNYWNIGIGHAKGDVESDKEGIEIMRTLGRNMAWLIKKISE